MVISMGQDVARTLLASGYAGSGDIALELHAAVAEPRRRYRQGWARMIEVEAAPDAWEHCAKWIEVECASPHGVRVVERNADIRLKSLARKIDKEIGRLCAHPAYAELAVKGHDSTVLPAYRLRLYGDDVAYGPPQPTRHQAMKAAGFSKGRLEAGQMTPEVVNIRGTVFTYWIFDEVVTLVRASGTRR
jgi:hypothetical protein